MQTSPIVKAQQRLVVSKNNNDKIVTLLSDVDSIWFPRDKRMLTVKRNGNINSIMIDDIDSIWFSKEKVDSRQSANLFDGRFTDGMAIYGSSGEICSDPDWKGYYVLSDKIFFDGHSNITCNLCPSCGFGYAIYDRNDNKIAYGSFLENLQTIENVTNGVYVRLTLMIHRSDPIMIAYGDTLPSYEPYNVQGKRINHISITSGKISDIRDTIFNIRDASANNVYVLDIRGTYVASKPTDYQNYGGNYAMFWLKPYIYIDGGDRKKCVFRAELPESVSECKLDLSSFKKSDYSIYQPLFIVSAGCQISNATFIARNIRYPLHIDGSNLYGSRNFEYFIKNCDLIHEGKFGDSVGTIGGSASGFGTSSGSHFLFDHCTFHSRDIGLCIHDNKGFEKKSVTDFLNCKFIPIVDGTATSIYIQCLANPMGQMVKINNCVFNKDSWINYGIIDTISERADDNGRAFLDTDLPPFPIYSGSIHAYGLMISCLKSVRFNPNSSAFDRIIGYSNDTTFIERNHCMRLQQYGYMWRDGGYGIESSAIGLRSIIKRGIYSLGNRLGDCRKKPLTLGVLIDNKERKVIFDVDYRTLTNKKIMASISSQLGADCYVSLYDVSSDMFPSFKGGSIQLVNDEVVKNGMGVIFEREGIRKAMSADNHIDGIVLDDGIHGQYVRVMTCGRISTATTSRYHILLDEKTDLDKCCYDTFLGIDKDRPGVFSLNYRYPSIKKKTDGVVGLIGEE